MLTHKHYCTECNKYRELVYERTEQHREIDYDIYVCPKCRNFKLLKERVEK